MVVLSKGANAALPVAVLEAQLSWSTAPGAPAIDLSALLLGTTGRVREDGDFVFFNQPRHASGAVSLERGRRPGTAQLRIDLRALESAVDRIVVVGSVDTGTLGGVPDLALSIADPDTGIELVRFEEMGATTETAFTAGELYRRSGGWRFRAVGQGWASGLAGLATEYGIDVDDEPAATSTPAPTVDDAPRTETDARGSTRGHALTQLAREVRSRLATSTPRTQHTAEPLRRSTSPVAYRPPGSLWPSVEVAGESHYAVALQRVLGRLHIREDREMEVDATLVPEPGNRHDRDAVAVQIAGATVGYLSREDALAWRLVLARLHDSAAVLTARARVWGCNRPAAEGGFYASVRLALPQPALALPLNPAPAAAHSILPWGARLKLSGEPVDLNPLASWLGAQQEGLLLVTLITRAEPLQRGGTRLYVDAAVDGTVVAAMTPMSSKNIAPLIEHLESRGLQTVAWASIRGSSLAVELGLQAARAQDVPADWLRADPMTVPRLS